MAGKDILGQWAFESNESVRSQTHAVVVRDPRTLLDDREEAHRSVRSQQRAQSKTVIA